MTATPFLFAVLGGLANGTFPIFIKTAAVVHAQLHPVIFQLYKSSCVALLGLALVAAHAFAFEFTWWGVASAGTWVPAGLCTIVAVPRIGVGSAMLTAASVSSWCSFLVFWLAFDEEVRTHTLRPGGAPVVLAPVFMFGSMLGMGGLVAAQHLRLKSRCSEESKPLTPDESSGTIGTELESSSHDSDEASLSRDGLVAARLTKRVQKRALTALVGFGAAIFGGFLSAAQYGLVTLGRRVSTAGSGERFNPLGSWMLSFGGGALGFSLASVALAAASSRSHGTPSPALKLRSVGVHGAAAGTLWCVGNLFNTLAVVQGGNAIVMPLSMVTTLIASGAWSLLWYREVRGTAAVAWAAAACWTAFMSVLLAMEKA
eukprot:CAMPEP_0183340836 /NCGR_PEP_ID=MMETSP0164_2-20130417/7255_1 /TAXON_ID=221442 /ORGANISM="Coccolithus pelagicus ssp braarudi, Strain PLY182g" /LENGTH=371 /DNA_ID=CAMNT_0025511037 /DNA_START=29 /DNA_END=1144 /DNA_ORIENTATION=-